MAWTLHCSAFSEVIMISAKKFEVVPEQNFWDRHRRLAEFNRKRLNPKFPSQNWRQELQNEVENRILENEILEAERRMIRAQACTAPREKTAFLRWFEDLKATGPGQNSPLFDWLATKADRNQYRWFIQQEVAGEAGFEDLTAITQVKIPTRAKLEMARNYWDEMGRGREAGMHGPMLGRVAKEFDLGDYDLNDIVPEALALGNVLVGMAVNREYAYHSIGALGVIELTAPGRAKKVYEGLKRLGISAEGQTYYLLHSALDIKHSEEWNREVLAPILEQTPEAAGPIAEGALMRLNAGARCFERYIRHFELRPGLY
jgi:hypothetical protein